MTDNTIVDMISTVGFPIVAFLLMYFQSTKTISKNTEAIHDLIIEIRRRK